jgi:hypothetical protein
MWAETKVTLHTQADSCLYWSVESSCERKVGEKDRGIFFAFLSFLSNVLGIPGE